MQFIVSAFFLSKMNKAFTLIELIIVTAILSTLLGFAVLTFTPDDDLVKKRNAVDTFVIHYHYAQEFALTENKYTHLVVNPALKEYRLFSSVVGEERVQEILLIENGRYGRVDLLEVFDEITFTNSDEVELFEITFSPWGTNTSLDNMFINFDDVQLNIEGLSGFVY